jgi:hypothetical protein
MLNGKGPTISAKLKISMPLAKHLMFILIPFGCFSMYKLVWTLCLMHRCVCIWRYILQNYNYKLHFQNLSTYHIPHVSIGTLAAENLDVCIACDPWDSNIQLTMVNDWRPGPGMPFLDSDTCAEVGGYLFLPGFSSLYEAILGWMTGRMDGWKKLHDHDILHYM